MHYFLMIAYVLILCLCLGSKTSCKADDSPGFFLKITKNIPRLGRRSDKEFASGFLKNYKAVPRIGRSVESEREFSFFTEWLNTQATKVISKRVPMSHLPLVDDERELSMVQPVNANTLMELLDKNAISRDNVKFVHWKDFDRALQLDVELYGKVISLGRKPDQRLKQDIAEGGYVPLMGNMVDADGTDFVLYNQDGGVQGPYASDLLRYNHI